MSNDRTPTLWPLAEIPQDLQAIIDAWPTLSEGVKAGILAMVTTARRERAEG